MLCSNTFSENKNFKELHYSKEIPLLGEWPFQIIYKSTEFISGAELDKGCYINRRLERLSFFQQYENDKNDNFYPHSIFLVSVISLEQPIQ